MFLDIFAYFIRTLSAENWGAEHCGSKEKYTMYYINGKFWEVYQPDMNTAIDKGTVGYIVHLM